MSNDGGKGLAMLAFGAMVATALLLLTTGLVGYGVGLYLGGASGGHILIAVVSSLMTALLGAALVFTYR